MAEIGAAPGRGRREDIRFQTGTMWLERSVVADVFGVQIAPQIMSGQVQGGIAQGFDAVTGAAVHDAQGHLLTGSFWDYAMLRATDLPFTPQWLRHCLQEAQIVVS